MPEDVATVAFRGLHALAGRGYKAELSVSDTPNAIWMRHPGRRRGVCLYSDGVVVVILENYNGGNELRFRHGDDEAFKEFVAGIPLPTPWERSRGFVVQFVARLFSSGCRRRF